MVMLRAPISGRPRKLSGRMLYVATAVARAGKIGPTHATCSRSRDARRTTAMVAIALTVSDTSSCPGRDEHVALSGVQFTAVA
jgi:hypothetical protein